MDKFIEQLKRHEGFMAHPYKCTAGKWTIGYGFNLTDAGIEHEGLVFNESYAERILRDQSKLSWSRVCGWYSDLDMNDCRRFVVANMVFNIGSGRFLGFKKMISALSRKDYNDAAKEMLDSLWAKQVGKRADELAAQMRTGEWQF